MAKYQKSIDAGTLLREVNIRKVEIVVNDANGVEYVTAGYLGFVGSSTIVLNLADRIVKSWNPTPTELEEQKIIADEQLEFLGHDVLVRRLASAILQLRVTNEMSSGQPAARRSE